MIIMIIQIVQNVTCEYISDFQQIFGTQKVFKKKKEERDFFNCKFFDNLRLPPGFVLKKI